MGSWYFSNFADATSASIDYLLKYGVDVHSGRWQGIPTEGKPDLVTKEVLNLGLEVPMYRPSWDEPTEGWLDVIADEIQPNLPWANEHFAERIGGKPLNPDPSHERWPWWHGQNVETKDEWGHFTHTYSERFWPKYANAGLPVDGIRYSLGDYDDVLNLLAEDPYTRQAYLPIFFPEDTGAVHRGRIPCTLGYHFLLRASKLHCWYHIRSCDAVRHFRDDLYLAAALVGHTLNQLLEKELRSDRRQLWVDVQPGTMYFTAYSFHLHKGDLHHVTPKPV